MASRRMVLTFFFEQPPNPEEETTSNIYVPRMGPMKRKLKDKYRFMLLDGSPYSRIREFVRFTSVSNESFVDEGLDSGWFVPVKTQSWMWDKLMYSGVVYMQRRPSDEGPCFAHMGLSFQGPRQMSCDC